MVRSIRHWCLATRLIEPCIDDASKKRIFRVSELGEFLLADDGWDPYLEDPASLWLLHWLLSTNPMKAAVWQIILSHYIKPEFTKQDLSQFLQNFAEKNELQVSEGTISRDIDCFIRTYLGSQASGGAVMEDSFNCPLIEIGLIQSMRDESLKFVIGPKLSLPAEIFGFALFEYLQKSGRTNQTMSIHECLYNPGSPGQVFKLDENSLFEYLERLGTLTENVVDVDETAGLKQIFFRSSFKSLVLLKKYYS